MNEIEDHQREDGDVQGERYLATQHQNGRRPEGEGETEDRRASARVDAADPGWHEAIASEHHSEPRRNEHARVQRGGYRRYRAEPDEPRRAHWQIKRGDLDHRSRAQTQPRARQDPEGNDRHCQVDEGGRTDPPDENLWQLSGAVFHLACRLRQRLEASVGKKERWQRGGEAADSMREERLVVVEPDREKPRKNEDGDRADLEPAERHLESAEPANSDRVREVEKPQAPKRERRAVRRTQQPARKLDHVFGESDRQIGQRTKVRDDLQPNADEGDPVASECP